MATRWTNPWIVGIVCALLGVAGTLVGTAWSNSNSKDTDETQVKLLKEIVQLLSAAQKDGRKLTPSEAQDIELKLNRLDSSNDDVKELKESVRRFAVEAETESVDPCEAGDAQACYRLAKRTDNVDTRAKRYRRSCELGKDWGCNNLGDMYIKGQLGRTDKAAAKAFFLRACELGLADACDAAATIQPDE